MENSVDERKSRIICNECSNMTCHRLVVSQSVKLPIYWGDQEADDVTELWELLQCLGCENFTLRVSNDFPKNVESEYTYFPERTVGHHQKKHYRKLPQNLESLYSEIVTAYNKKLLLLCIAGLRALLEGLCADKGIIKGLNQHGKNVSTLEGKINGLTSIVPKGIVGNLHGLRILGNQALHELEAPKLKDLKLALTIVEDILNVVYDLDYRASILYQNATRPKGTPPIEEEISI